MHRLGWTIDGASTTCYSQHGFFAFPTKVAAALTARGVLLLPQQAWLLTAAGPLPLAPGVAPVQHGCRLQWEPEGASSLTTLCTDTTCGEGEGTCQPGGKQLEGPQTPQ